MTRGKNHARLSTGRTDSNGRPSGSRRRTQIDWCPEDPTTAFERTLENAGFGPFDPDPDAQAEAGHQSLDGLHPEEA